jgi:hypothetical protein
MTLLDQALNKVSSQIISTIANDVGRRQMGTTLSMVLIIDKFVFLAHVGNSQVYLRRDTSFHLLTDDHSDKKKKSNSELSLYEEKGSSLTRMLGMSDHLKIDLLYFEVMPGDDILLFTDGVSGVLAKKHFQEIIKTSKENLLAKSFVETAKSNNNQDNATAVAICFERPIIDVEHGPAATATVAAISPQHKYLALQKIPLFSELDYKEISKIVDLMNFRKILINNNVVVEGEVGNELFVILKGTANVVLKNNIIANLVTGNYFGEISLIDSERRSATVVATSDIDVLILDRQNLNLLLINESQLSVKILWRLAQTLAARMRLANQQVTITQKDKTRIDTELLSKITINFDE